MGYADIGPFGATAYKTPHLDRMAAEGRIFTDFHSATAVCSASRAALMTGCYPERVSILGALFPQAKIGINADEITLAELCRTRGYATAIYGKWHLGHHKQFLPLQNGFDEYFGLPYSNDMSPLQAEMIKGMSAEAAARKRNAPPLPLFKNNEIIDPAVSPEKLAQLTTLYTEHAVSFIDRHKDQPFLLYVPHTMVHVPLAVSEKFKGKSGAGLYGDVVMELDWSVGQILDAIKRNGLDDNTLVLFTSDNGPWLTFGNHGGSAGPLREGKGTMWEGGYREPCVIDTEIVGLINSLGGTAMGLSGKDARLLCARKAIPGPGKPDLGFVGEIESVNADVIDMLLERNYIPVISPVGMGDDGQSYNINADVAAAEIAVAARAHKLIFLTDVAGVLDGDGRLISEIRADRSGGAPGWGREGRHAGQDPGGDARAGGRRRRGAHRRRAQPAQHRRRAVHGQGCRYADHAMTLAGEAKTRTRMRRRQGGAPRQRRAGHAARRDAIREILAAQAVTSQHQLAKLLATRGIVVAQATLSRDLFKLGVVRVPGATAAGEAGRYRVPDDDGALPIERVHGLVDAVRSNGAMVVVRTKAGVASTVARALDDARLDGVLGSRGR